VRFTPQLRDLKWLVNRPVAHRGLHNKAKEIFENTSLAFAAAIKNNYAIECDLQISADGEAMVFHDEKLDRLTAEKGLLRERPAKQLQKLTIGRSQDRMQILAEMLEQVNEKVTLIIELKSHWDGDTALALRALRVLESYQGPYALMSFDPELMAAVAAVSPHTVRGITADRTVDKYYGGLPLARRIAMRNFEHLAETRPHFVSYYFRDMPFPAIQNIRSAGHPVISWTIRSPEQESLARRWSDQITFEGYGA
jgi:glycerophosphoryl diester phosphodiesterase